MFSQLKCAALLLTLCLVAAAFCSACQERAPRLAPLPSDALILAFGDSLTAGTGASGADSYPAVLQRLTGYSVINAGQPGELSGDGLTRLPALLERHQPTLVLLCHGGNDMLRRHDTARTSANLAAMIEMIRDNGAQVLLLAVPRPGLRLRPAPFYRELARHYQIPYDTSLAQILSERELKSDTVHPNAAGYRRLAESLAGQLAADG